GHTPDRHSFPPRRSSDLCQGERPPHEMSILAPCNATTSVRPSPSKSPKRSWLACSGMRFKKRHSDWPPEEKYQPAPVPTNTSSMPSPSKSPTARSAVGLGALNVLAQTTCFVGSVVAVTMAAPLD